MRWSRSPGRTEALGVVFPVAVRVYAVVRRLLCIRMDRVIFVVTVFGLIEAVAIEVDGASVYAASLIRAASDTIKGLDIRPSAGRKGEAHSEGRKGLHGPEIYVS